MISWCCSRLLRRRGQAPGTPSLFPGEDGISGPRIRAKFVHSSCARESPPCLLFVAQGGLRVVMWTTRWGGVLLLAMTFIAHISVAMEAQSVSSRNSWAREEPATSYQGNLLPLGSGSEGTHGELHA
jgi:hypothetical protein